MYSIILTTASALGAASAAAVSYPFGITIIMKRIQISFNIDSSQHRLFYLYVEYIGLISTTSGEKLLTQGRELRLLCPTPWMTSARAGRLVTRLRGRKAVWRPKFTHKQAAEVGMAFDARESGGSESRGVVGEGSRAQAGEQAKGKIKAVHDR